MALRKTFTGGMNTDDAPEYVAEDQYLNLENAKVFFSEDGKNGYVEPRRGTELIWGNLPGGDNKCIGSAADERKTFIIWCNYNSLGNHGIYLYMKEADTVYPVLLSADVEGGLNFSATELIHSCFVHNGIFYWVNGRQNEPRRIVIDPLVKAYDPSFTTVTPGMGVSLDTYSLPVSQDTIAWIRKPGAFPLITQKGLEPAAADTYNYIKDGAFLFAYRYVYDGNEASVLSMPSRLENYNIKEGDFNYIDVALPAQESISQDVRHIDLVVRYVEDDSYFVIHRWDNPSQAVADHNSGAGQLTYRFFNNVTGEPLSDEYKVRMYDNVPRYASALEVAKDRAFMADLTEGYDAPKEIVLNLTPITDVITGSVVTITGQWFEFTGKNKGGGTVYTVKLLRLTHPLSLVVTPAAYYYYLPVGTSVPPFPLSISQANLEFVGTSIESIKVTMQSKGHGAAAFGTLHDEQKSSVVNTSGTAIDFISLAFKSGGRYGIGVTFYDRYMRKCGIVKPGNADVLIPDNRDTDEYTTAWEWQLAGVAADEIPEWAWYYSINLTKNFVTRWFVGGVGLVQYISRDTDGDIVTGNTFFGSSNIGIDLSCLPAFGMGYAYNEGDIAIVRYNGSSLALPVTGREGQWLLLQAEDIGALSGNVIFEIYTPYKKDSNDTYYETGEMYAIDAPGTPAADYTVKTGVLTGDTYLIKRKYSSSNFVAECMSPSDRKWNIWNTNTGRPNMVDLIGERRLPSEGRFSGKFVHGTTVNGLSSFGPLDVFTADQRMGPINKLVLASKVQTAGSVLLAVCSSGSGSYYLGEQEITDSEGSSFVAKSSRVISDINPFQREYGTKNPESVVVADGLVYWWDIERGVVVQYGSNGLFAVSSRKVSEAVAAISKSYTGGDIVGGFDYDGDELIFSVPETSAAPRSGYLQTWNAIPFPYDLHDGKEKTIFFLRKEINQWAGSGRWTAESYVAAGKEFYCFKGGALYQMNEGGYAHYFNVQHPVRVMFSVHAGLLSSFLNLSVESNKAPSFVQMRTDDPYVQETDLVEGDFKDKGGVYWSEILRDRLSPNVAAHPLINGDRMQGRYVQVMMEFDVSGGGFYLRGVGMGSDRL